MPDSSPSDTSIDSASATDGVPEVSTALGALQEELEALAEATAHIEASKEAARRSAEASEAVCDQSQALAASTERLIERIDGIDFPRRFDKLDATIAGINTGVQNLQGRLNDTERALREDLSELRSDQKESHQTHMQAMNRLYKQGKEHSSAHAYLKKRLHRTEYLLYTAIVLSLLVCGLVLFV